MSTKNFILLAILITNYFLMITAKTRIGTLPIAAKHYLERKLTFEDETKIVGGNVVTDISQRPFQVSYELYFPGYFSVPVCGGAIIDDYTVLTAAHCCLDLINDDVIVRTGALKVPPADEDGKTFEVVKIIVDPRYDAGHYKYDGCILKTSEPVTSVYGAAPVDLPEPGMTFQNGDLMKVSGWGALSSNGQHSEELRMVTVPFVSDTDCKESYGENSIWEESMLCAGEAGKDSCEGDSGGPLTYNDVHVGIVSWGQGCALPGYPGVYAQTDAFLDFIRQNSGPIF